MTTTSETPNPVEEANPGLKDVGRYEFGWSDKNDVGADAKRGLSEEVVRNISALKSEPDWMLEMRLKGLK
ncbi:MAG: Fe-S cluster assembly protein SufB, partial [Aeromicrobium sp.]